MAVLLVAFTLNFNSRPHEEVDLSMIAFDTSMQISTHDLTKRSTIIAIFSRHKRTISTHDLTKRSTWFHVSEELEYYYFNSRPHEEVDSNAVNVYRNTGHFNSRPHEEVEWHLRDFAPHITHFNSRPHEEVEKNSRNLKAWGLFQLTTSRRGRVVPLSVSPSVEYFNSRPHEEVEGNVHGHFHSARNFNSRPHEEVEISFRKLDHRFKISTHDLTKRSRSNLK